MRQIQKLLPLIDRKIKTEWYELALSYKIAQCPELPSLDQLLGTESNNESDAKAFDENAEKVFEIEALKNLERKRAALGK